MLCYDYDNTIENPHPNYSKTFTHREVKLNKHQANKRFGYMITEFTIDLGTKLYTYTYAHYTNYKKDI